MNKPDFKGLILVPGKAVCVDWRKRIKDTLPEFINHIEIQTYAYMAGRYMERPSEYFDYLVVDEAHHAVAPVLKRVIQYYNADFTIGLTATDQRPDRKRLEAVFRELFDVFVLKRSNGKRNCGNRECL